MGSDKFSVGIIGCGRWGANHARTALKLWRNEVRWLCDLRSSTLDPFRPLVGTQATRFSEQPQEVFADPETKAVIIAAPAAQHYELTRAALLAGKDVLVEKPLSLQSSQARALVALAGRQEPDLDGGAYLALSPSGTRA
jgi:UDP-2-acetamido-3-amino-2,3-dideoxy-glucuronate N-acetyltransferase